MKEIVAKALQRWDMADARTSFIAGRENQVFRISSSKGDFALRIRRPGLRSQGELISELHWLCALSQAGLTVPQPRASHAGKMLENILGHYVDLVSWLPGRPMGKGRVPLSLEQPARILRQLGQDMARLHDISDDIKLPQGFTRPAWDKEGFIGDQPLWGRFWDNPKLSPEQRELLLRFREVVKKTLSEIGCRLDYGLIHADIIRENVLIDGVTIRFIDFDDGGFGYRIFDLATTLFKLSYDPRYELLKAALIEGYLSQRPLDLMHLDLFIALRAATYVGWNVPRLAEDGAYERNARFIREATDLAKSYLSARTLSL